MFYAKLKYVRLSCTKTFFIVDKIRGMRVIDALNILKFSNKKSAKLLKKLLYSAVANAYGKNLNIESLFIKEIFSNQATSLKRLKPCAKGRSSRILKRSCHITVVLSKLI